MQKPSYQLDASQKLPCSFDTMYNEFLFFTSSKQESYRSHRWHGWHSRHPLRHSRWSHACRSHSRRSHARWSCSWWSHGRHAGNCHSRRGWHHHRSLRISRRASLWRRNHRTSRRHFSLFEGGCSLINQILKNVLKII